MYICDMDLFFLVVGVFFACKWLIEKIFSIPINFNNNDDLIDNSTTIINNHYNENHLHVNDKFLNNFNNKQNEQNGKT